MKPSSCKVFTLGVGVLAGRCVGKGMDVGPLSGDVRPVQLFLKTDLDERKLATVTYLGLRSEKIGIVLTS